MTSIEKVIQEILDNLEIEYISQYKFKDAMTCDFAIPALKLIIECDGCYWHSCPKHHPKANITNDKERDKYTEYHGWKTIRLWEHDIKNNPEKCIDIISKHISTL